MRKLASQLTYSRVISTVALFAALGGSAYAISLGKGTVNSPIIKNGSVKSVDVRNDGLKGKDILESSLDTAQLGAVASAGPTLCDWPGSTASALCATTTIQTPVAGRVFAIASGELISQSTTTTAASCVLTIDGETAGEMPDQVRTSAELGFTVSGVSSRALPAGAHTVELTCVQRGGAQDLQVYGLTAIGGL